MDKKEQHIMATCASNQESRWVALDNNDKVISEGKSPNEVVNDAQRQTEDYSIVFIPAPGNTYIF